MTDFNDDIGRRLIRYEVLLFALAAIAGRFVFGGLTFGTYARMLAWAALLSWVLAVLIVGMRWFTVRFDSEPMTHRHGQQQLNEWSGFFFLAGMVPFAVSALLGWLA